MAAHIELEGEVLAGLTTDAVAALGQHCDRLDVDVRRVLDIGSGPGVGTCVLAQRFADALVVAVDSSAAMLEHATSRAARLGLDQRVEVRLVDLPEGLATLGRADVAWASMSLHHLGDEVGALRRVRQLLEPRGVFALVEHERPVRVLPDDADLGRPGLWDRLDVAWTAWFAAMRAELPDATPSADHSTMLAAAGFELIANDDLMLVLDAPLDDRAHRFAHGQLVGMRRQLAEHADASDLAAIDALIDEGDDDNVLGRDDLAISASRRVYIARPA